MTSGPYSLSMILHGVLAIIMGGLSDKFGPRFVVTISGFFLGLGYLLMSQTSVLWQLYLFYGVIIGIGISGMWVPLLSAVARWFVAKRSLMSGIVVAGGGIGSFIAAPVTGWLIANHGWRLACVILGSAAFIVTVVASQFLKRDPIAMGQLPYGEGANGGNRQKLKPDKETFSLREAARTTQFWLAFVILLCFGFGMIAITVHIVPHAIDLGVAPTSAANILAIRGGVGIFGTYILGGLGDRMGNRKIFIIGFSLTLLALLWLQPAREVWMLYLFAAVFGFAVGGMGTSESPLVASLFGLSSHGLIYGVLGLGFTLGASVGPILTGYIFDATGSYQIAFWVCSAFAILGLVLAAILRPPQKLSTLKSSPLSLSP